MPFVDINSKKILFIHIPRTGGSTVEDVLRTQGKLRFFTYGVPPSTKITPQHFTRNEMINLFGEGYFDHMFTLVRNPFDRMVSEYKLRAITGHHGFYGGFPRFSAWIESNMNEVLRNRFHLDNHLRPQYEFVGDDVDVFKFEDGMEALFATLHSNYGIQNPVELPQKYNTNTFQEEIAWDSASRDRVAEFYRRDFEAFGYSAEPSPNDPAE